MRNAVAGIAVLMMGTAPALALEGPGRALVASNQLQVASNPAVTGDPGGAVSRAFIVPYSGTARVKWEFKSRDGTQASADVDVPHTDACHKTTVSTDFVAQTCDLRVRDGMPVSLSFSPDNATNRVTVRKVSLSFTVVNSKGEPIEFEVNEQF